MTYCLFDPLELTGPFMFVFPTSTAMKETIRYDACDENSWDRVGSMEMYPIR